jgi:hypothetical protein
MGRCDQQGGYSQVNCYTPISKANSAEGGSVTGDSDNLKETGIPLQTLIPKEKSHESSRGIADSHMGRKAIHHRSETPSYLAESSSPEELGASDTSLGLLPREPSTFFKAGRAVRTELVITCHKFQKPNLQH